MPLSLALAMALALVQCELVSVPVPVRSGLGMLSALPFAEVGEEVDTDPVPDRDPRRIRRKEL